MKELNDLIDSYQRVGMLCNKVSTDTVIRELKKSLGPSVPQFVADWYENHKDDLEYDIWEYLIHWGEQQSSEFYEWMNYASNKPIQTLFSMHQFGYTVIKEKHYIVSVKGIMESSKVLKHLITTDSWFFSNIEESHYYRTKHTMEELQRAGFSSVFGNALFEVEEVE